MATFDEFRAALTLSRLKLRRGTDAEWWYIDGNDAKTVEHVLQAYGLGRGWSFGHCIGLPASDLKRVFGEIPAEVT
jgi:hypothetical protein